MTREAGGTTNLTRTQYAYSYAGYHRQVVRTEQDYGAGWVNSNQVTYKYMYPTRGSEAPASRGAP